MKVDGFPTDTEPVNNSLSPREKRAESLKELDRIMSIPNAPSGLKFTEQLKVLSLSRQVLHTDALTGLQNETGADESFADLLETSKTENSIAFVSINISGFRIINSTLNHSAGDELLINFAKSVASIFRTNPANPMAERRGSSAGPNDNVSVRLRDNGFVVFFETDQGVDGTKLRASIEKRLQIAFDNALKDAKDLVGLTSTQDIGSLDEVTVQSELSLLPVAELKSQGPTFQDVLGTITHPETRLSNTRNFGEQIVRAAHSLLASPKDTTEGSLSKKVRSRKDRIQYLEAQLMGNTRTRHIFDSSFEPSFDTADASSSSEQGYDDDLETKILELINLYHEAIDTDSTTGLKNRHWLEAELGTLSQEYNESEDEPKSGYILMIDLTKFGDINKFNYDTMAAGDRTIEQFAEIINKKCIKFSKKYNCQIDAVRTGGDEFHLLITNIDPSNLVELFNSNQEDNLNLEKALVARINKDIIETTLSELKVLIKKSSTLHHTPGIHTGKLLNLAELFKSGIRPEDLLAAINKEGDVSKEEISRGQIAWRILASLGNMAYISAQAAIDAARK
ncbi:MAG: hypothetical protein QG647_384 [Patescibacteria group bacterium]|nr:hypothetical protein [Patescibacteria group bacterium]